MGTYVSSQDKVREGDNRIKEFVDRKLFDNVTKRYEPLFVPFLTPGWSDEVRERMLQAESLPTILDHTRTKRDFPTTSIAGIDFKYVFNHYCQGLVQRYDHGRHLGFNHEELQEHLCALGYGLVTHHAVAEFGLSLTTERLYDDDVCEAFLDVLKYRYQKSIESGFSLDGIDLDQYLHVRASFPRGKNTGLPFLAPGSDRFNSNLILALCAAFASLALYDDELYNAIKSNNWLKAYVVFSRYQHTGKSVPMWMWKEFTSYNLEGRRRIINAACKILSMMIKPANEFFTKWRITIPEFSQDRDALFKRRREHKFVIPTDISRFDLSNGGRRLKQGLTVMARFLKWVFPDIPNNAIDALFYEATRPTLIDVGQEDTRMNLADSDALRSGSGSTSNVGSIITHLIFMQCLKLGGIATTRQELCDFYIRNSPAISMGDDCEGYFNDPAIVTKYFEGMKRFAELFKIKVAVEDPPRFMGYYLFDPRHKTTEKGLYHGNSSLNNLYFPERFRKNLVPSLVTRAIMLLTNDYREVIANVTRVMTDEQYLNRVWLFVRRHLLPYLLPFWKSHPRKQIRAEAQRIEEIEVLSIKEFSRSVLEEADDILNIFAHGGDFEYSSELFGVEFESSEQYELKATLSELVDTHLREAYDATSASIRTDQNLSITRAHAIAEWFNAKEPMEFYRIVESQASIIFRRVDTDFGTFWSVKR